MKSATNHGGCFGHLGLDACFHEYNSHDSRQASVIRGIGHSDPDRRLRYNCLTDDTVKAFPNSTLL